MRLGWSCAIPSHRPAATSRTVRATAHPGSCRQRRRERSARRRRPPHEVEVRPRAVIGPAAHQPGTEGSILTAAQDGQHVQRRRRHAVGKTKRAALAVGGLHELTPQRVGAAGQCRHETFIRQAQNGRLREPRAARQARHKAAARARMRRRRRDRRRRPQGPRDAERPALAASIITADPASAAA